MAYNLFISHSWTYSDAYDGLVKLLKKAEDDGFYYKDYSVPKNDPIHNANNDRQLKEAIRNQMKHASCVLILAGVYATYSKWINIEIELAKEMGKRIIAVSPWGAERISSVVRKSADDIVRWNTESITSAIIKAD
ncbi:MAG: TIR domain-containing protein [Paludibacteraceae bacterium]|nr:TIR domain-containing protein [Paludibacteraceae bacterium]